jgi:hypothetical protein
MAFAIFLKKFSKSKWRSGDKKSLQFVEGTSNIQEAIISRVF